MGQRHQFFIVMPNPVKFQWSKNWQDKKKAIKDLGNGKTTIIAIHHGWMFGRSALVNLMNVMDFSNSELRNKYHNPFSTECQIHSYADWTKRLMEIIQVQANPLHPRGLGYEDMIYLNDEEPEMRDRCDIGDNNDGITIIDTINRKYCFMNVYDQDLSKDGDRVARLPKLEPTSAEGYAKAYYPKGGNRKFTKPLDKYEVLTKAEVSTIFPKMEEFKEVETVV